MINKPLINLRKTATTGIVALMTFAASAAMGQSSVKSLQKDTVQIQKTVIEKSLAGRLFSLLKTDSVKSQNREAFKAFKNGHKVEYKAIKPTTKKPYVVNGSFLIFPKKNGYKKGSIILDSTQNHVFSDWNGAVIIGTSKNDKMILNNSKSVKYLPLAGADSTKMHNCQRVIIVDNDGANSVSLNETDSLITITNRSPGSTIFNESKNATFNISNTTLFNNNSAVNINLSSGNTVENGKKNYDLRRNMTKTATKQAKLKKDSSPTAKGIIKVNGKNNTISNYDFKTSIYGNDPSTNILINVID